MTKLTDLQSILLSAASQRDDGSLYPLPTSAADAGDPVDKAIASLLKRGLVVKSQAQNAAATYSNTTDIVRELVITDIGLAAIGVGAPESMDERSLVSIAAPTSTTKAAMVMALLQRSEGATLADLIEATGWLPHTTRAALTGIRHKGHFIDKTQIDGVTTYRVAVAG